MCNLHSCKFMCSVERSVGLFHDGLVLVGIVFLALQRIHGWCIPIILGGRL